MTKIISKDNIYIAISHYVNSQVLLHVISHFNKKKYIKSIPARVLQLKKY